MIDATVIVLTRDERLHIGRLLSNLCHRVKRICVVDSESKDGTRDIAVAHGAEILVNPWPGNHALQLNWALDNIEISTEWVIRLDADEVVPDGFLLRLGRFLDDLSPSVGAIYLQRRHVFLGKEIRFGSFRPARILRVWRCGSARCDERLMDEKIFLKPGTESAVFKDIFWDWNLNGLSHWIDKHNDYASREALELVIENDATLRFSDRSFNIQGQNDWRKVVYRLTPAYFRPLLFFGYRFLVCAGFLDGFRGFLWHFFQGLWYRYLVEAKVLEMNDRIQTDWDNFSADVQVRWGYRLVRHLEK